MSDPLLTDVLTGLLRELLEGPQDASFIVNPGDPGIIGSLSRLSAADASARPDGRASVAAHVHHLRYGFGLLNRWADGDTGAFDHADFAAAWQHQQVSDAEWPALRAGLEQDVRRCIGALGTPRDWDPLTLGGAIGSMAHLAYHPGAIRQITAAAAGPSAND